MKKETQKIGPGRPKVKDCAQSYTVSLRPTETAELIKKFGSLTNAVKSLL